MTRTTDSFWNRIASWLHNTSHPYFAAVSFGCLSALAFAPTGLFPILWICFPALVFLIQRAPTFWQAFLTGWCFAFGMFLIGLYWIAAAMFVDIAHFWWAVPLAAAGLPAFFAIYYGAASALAWKVGTKGLSGSLAFALLWFLADVVRGHLFTGFPWNLEGYAWTHVLPILQSVSLFGIYGLTLITLVAAFLPAALIEGSAKQRPAFYGSLLVFAVLLAWGGDRLQEPHHLTDIGVRIVQPNIDQAHKWIADEQDAHFKTLLDLSSAPSQNPLRFIIWPETAPTFYLAEDAYHRREVARAIPDNASLLTGVIRREPLTNGHFAYFNSLIAINHAADVLGIYDKAHLVPFGEYIPGRDVLPVHALASMGIDFSSGDRAHTLHMDGLPSFSPFICYEAIFPGKVADEHDRPQFLVNVTNDGWYGRTAGPYQHFAIARVRAIEEGLPLVRAANTGISGVVDAYGRVTAHLDLGETGSLDTNLPQALPPTFYSRFGESPAWVLFGLLAIPAGFRQWRHSNRQ